MEFNQNQPSNSKPHQKPQKLDSSSHSSQQNQPQQTNSHQATPLTENVTSLQKVSQYFHGFLSLYNPYHKKNSLQQHQNSNLLEKNNSNQFLPIFSQSFQLTPQLQYFYTSDTSEQQKKANQNTLNFLQKYQDHYRESIEKVLLKSQRFKKTETFTKNLVVHEFYPSKHYEIVKLQIQLLWYKTQILILNELQNSPLQNFSDISGSGSFGYVYCVHILEDQIAIKSIPFHKDTLSQDNNDDPNTFRKTMLGAFKEYFFLLLFSELEIGPKVKTIGGFDMVVFEDCVLFGSQICDEISTKNTNQCNFEFLYECLFKMHMLQIVHRDIKPTNIMFSESLNKCIFIDFGCSEGLEESIGYKTLTKFVGTTAFCGDELLLLLSKSTGMTDLYYNDFYGLVKSIQLEDFKIKMEEDVKEKMYIQSFEFEIYRMKYLLYKQAYKEFRFLWKLVNMNWYDQVEEIEVKLLKFYPELKPNEFLKKFFWTQISQNSRQNPQFKSLIPILKSSNSQSISYFCREFFKQNNYHFFESFYKYLPVSDGKLNQEEREIYLILADKNALKLRVFGSQIKPDTNKNIFKQKQVIHYFLYVAKYSQIGLNEYQIDIESKIKACNQALSIIKKIDPTPGQRPQLIFDCPIQKFQPINQFCHQFLQKIWPNLSQMYKQQFVSQMVSTLCFLGFPVESKPSLTRIYMYFIDEQPSCNIDHVSRQDRIQKILYYWETRLMFLIFEDIFYNRSKNKSKISFGSKFSSSCKSFVKKLFEIHDQEKDEFFRINHKFHQQLLMDHLNFNEKKFCEIYEILNGPLWKKPQFSTYRIKKWRYMMQIALCYISFSYKIKDAWKIYQSMEQVMFFTFKYNKAVLPYLLSFIYAEFVRTYQQTYVIFEKIDQMVSCKQLSLRFNIQYRMALSLDKDDIDAVYNITSMIMSETNASQFEVQNLTSLRKIMQCIHCFILNRLRNKNHISRVEAIEFVRCSEFFKMALEVGFNYDKWKIKDNFIPLIKLPKIVVSITQIERSLALSMLIRSYFVYLLKLGQIFKKLDKHLITHPQVKNTQFQILGLAKKTTLEAIMLEKKHYQFLEQIPKQDSVFNFVMQWIQIMKVNQHIRKTIQQSRTICLQFVTTLIHQRKILGKDIKTDEIINQLFGTITALSFDTENSSNLPNQEVVFDYFYIKISLTKYDLHWCQQFIAMYKNTLKRGSFTKIVHKQGLMRTLLNCFIKTHRAYQEIEELIYQCTLSINENPIMPVVKQVELHLNKLFWCECEKCLEQRGQSWDINRLIEAFYQKLNFSNAHTNPYMSLAYLHIMTYMTINKEISWKFTLYIIKSVNFLISSVRQEIKTHIYYLVYAINHKLNREVFEIKAWTKQNLAHSMISKDKIKDKPVRRFMYFFTNFLKNKPYNYFMVDERLERRFFREYLIEGYRYPSVIKEKYKKKLRRYYNIKENSIVNQFCIKRKDDQFVQKQ